MERLVTLTINIHFEEVPQNAPAASNILCHTASHTGSDGKKGCSGEDYVEACLNACVSMQNVWRYCALPEIQRRWHVMRYNSSESSESEMWYSRKRVAVQGSNIKYDTYIPKCKGSINIRWWINCICWLGISWDDFLARLVNCFNYFTSKSKHSVNSNGCTRWIYDEICYKIYPKMN